MWDLLCTKWQRERFLFFRVVLFSPVSVIPPKLRTHLHLHTNPIRRTSGQHLGTFKQRKLFPLSESGGCKVTVTFLFRLQRPSRWTVLCRPCVIVLFRLLSHVLPLSLILFHNCHGHWLIFFPLECITLFVLVEWSWPITNVFLQRVMLKTCWTIAFLVRSLLIQEERLLFWSNSLLVLFVSCNWETGFRHELLQWNMLIELEYIGGDFFRDFVPFCIWSTCHCYITAGNIVSLVSYVLLRYN